MKSLYITIQYCFWLFFNSLAPGDFNDILDE